MKKFPEKLFVIREEEGTENEFMTASADPSDHAAVDGSVRVAVYKFDSYALVSAPVTVTKDG